MEIDCWVMSCRVFGRQLETEAMSIAVELARARGVRALLADYLPTAKNGVIRELYAGLGFVQLAAAADGASRWRLDLDSWSPRATFITRRVAGE
jgi:predicted enzyme involved in methoxymalonyl-ACP biosynthesis